MHFVPIAYFEIYTG